MTDLGSTISSNAQGPREARGDGITVSQHPLRDLVAADRYLAGKTALADRTRRSFGVRFGRLIPPGAI